MTGGAEGNFAFSLVCAVSLRLDCPQRPAEDVVRYDSGKALGGRPGNDFWVFGRLGAEIVWVHRFAGPGQIETVGVETGLHGDMLVRSRDGVKVAGGEQEVE